MLYDRARYTLAATGTFTGFRTESDGRYPSDHFPVWADVAVEAR